MKLPKVTRNFFDFYSINELYLRCGGFRDIGYDDYPVFVSHRIEVAIREAYEETVNSFYAEVYAALVASIKSELQHYPCSCSHDATFKFEKLGISKQHIRSAKAHPSVYPELAHMIFTVPKWSAYYGGKKWAKGTQLLLDSKNVKTLSDKVYWIDRVLDLYHNCGHMLNKTKFRVLSEQNITRYPNRKWTTTPLNYRAKARSITDFLRFNSDSIARLVIPRKNILTPSV